ncbi:MAG TPA: DNA repair protein RecN [Polyangiaceae bacterium]|jgi:DNA repair protein RecN (Recombination protein N)
MLIELRVRNFVLLEQLALPLERGFNVLTGETGAGKSIVVGALGLVLGGRAAPDLVRPGADEAEVEALFDVSAQPGARALLARSGLDEGDEVVCRRVVQSTGRSRAYINGRLCTVTQLAELAGELVDISSQHESVSLTDPATHLGYLDSFARLEAEKAALAAIVDQLVERSKELTEREASERNREEREAFLRFQLSAIDEVSPHPGEVAELEAERSRLRHSDRLSQLTRRAAARLYDEDGAICDELARIGGELGQARELDPTLGPLCEQIESAQAELVEAARGISRYAEGVEADPGRLAEVDERLFQLAKLTRQHGGDIAAVLAARARIASELESSSDSEGWLTTARADVARFLAQASETARELSAARKKAAVTLGSLIGKELDGLGMGRARVVVEVAPQRGGSEFEVEGATLGREGIDRVEFLIAPNPGVEPRPLRRIASGGELSRALLALKRALADGGPRGLYVFDEVDAGVGGAVAERIGRAIADVAKHRQVLCITHLASIAAFADAHFVVEKVHDANIASTRVSRCSGKDRLAELARMLAGNSAPAAARKAAEEMLRDARRESATNLAKGDRRA